MSGLVRLKDRCCRLTDFVLKQFWLDRDQFSRIGEDSLDEYFQRSFGDLNQFEHGVVRFPDDFLLFVKRHGEDGIVDVLVEFQHHVFDRGQGEVDVFVDFRVRDECLFENLRLQDAVDHETARSVGLEGARVYIPVIIPEEECVRLDFPLRDIALIILVDDLQARVIPPCPVNPVEDFLIDFAGLGGEELHLGDKGTLHQIRVRHVQQIIHRMADFSPQRFGKDVLRDAPPHQERHHLCLAQVGGVGKIPMQIGEIESVPTPVVFPRAVELILQDLHIAPDGFSGACEDHGL